MVTGDRLRVTVEDIEIERRRVTTPPVLTILPEEVPESPPLTGARTGHKILITAEDIAAFGPASEEVVSALEQIVFQLVNEARAANIPAWMRRKPLLWYPTLAQAARRHADDMLDRRYVAHTTPEGYTVGNRLDRAHISYLACGENIGTVYGPASHGDPGLQTVHAAFMNQPRRLMNHRANILNPIWTHVGIGVAYTAAGQLIVTQNFIATLTRPV